MEALRGSFSPNSLLPIKENKLSLTFFSFKNNLCFLYSLASVNTAVLDDSAFVAACDSLKILLSRH